MTSTQIKLLSLVYGIKRSSHSEQEAFKREHDAAKAVFKFAATLHHCSKQLADPLPSMSPMRNRVKDTFELSEAYCVAGS
ncbi:unnamed protein product [Calypogeia fissa]